METASTKQLPLIKVVLCLPRERHSYAALVANETRFKLNVLPGPFVFCLTRILLLLAVKKYAKRKCGWRCYLEIPALSAVTSLTPHRLGHALIVLNFWQAVMTQWWLFFLFLFSSVFGI